MPQPDRAARPDTASAIRAPRVHAPRDHAARAAYPGTALPPGLIGKPRSFRQSVLWVPSQSGLSAVALQPQNQTSSVFSAV